MTTEKSLQNVLTSEEPRLRIQRLEETIKDTNKKWHTAKVDRHAKINTLEKQIEDAEAQRRLRQSRQFIHAEKHSQALPPKKLPPLPQGKSTKKSFVLKNWIRIPNIFSLFKKNAQPQSISKVEQTCIPKQKQGKYSQPKKLEKTPSQNRCTFLKEELKNKRKKIQAKACLADERIRKFSGDMHVDILIHTVDQLVKNHRALKKAIRADEIKHLKAIEQQLLTAFSTDTILINKSSADFWCSSHQNPKDLGAQISHQKKKIVFYLLALKKRHAFIQKNQNISDSEMKKLIQQQDRTFAAVAKEIKALYGLQRPPPRMGVGKK